MQANSILYGRILFVGIPFMVLQQAFLSFYVAAEKPSLSLIVSIVSGVINMILDYMLIVPLDMGLAGAALATVLSQVIGGIFPVFCGKTAVCSACNFPFRCIGKPSGLPVQTALLRWFPTCLLVW